MDIVCGGSPCQDLSIAGLRAGLAGARSGPVSYTHLKAAPVISKVEQQPDSGHTEMTLAVTATDADSGVKGLSLIHIYKPDAAALRDAKRGHKARIGYARIVLVLSLIHI